MTGISSHSEKYVSNYPLEILVDQNSRKDGVIKDFKDWPTAYLLRLQELLEAELYGR